MKVLREDSSIGKTLNELESFLREHKISINDVEHITIQGRDFIIKDTCSSGTQSVNLPRTFDTEKFVVVE